MANLIEIYQSDLVDALHFFEYHGTKHRRLKQVKQDKEVKALYKLIRDIKFPGFKYFVSWSKDSAVMNDIATPEKLAKYILENPPRRKVAETWVNEINKVQDVITEMYTLYLEKSSKDERKKLEKKKKELTKSYKGFWKKFREESEKLKGIDWSDKDLVVCLVYPIDGRFSYKSTIGEIYYIEGSDLMVDREGMFLHQIVQLLNYTKPIGSWIRQDKSGMRAIAYELFTEMQTLHIMNKITGKKPDFKSVVLDKLNNIWIPLLRPETEFDQDELERVLTNAYKLIPKHEFEPLYQMGELYTELSIILLE